MKNTLWHINWGHDDDFFVVARSKEKAIEAMPDGKNMVNYVIRHDALYEQIFQAGMREVVKWVENHGGSLDGLRKEWHAFKKSKGIPVLCS